MYTCICIWKKCLLEMLPIIGKTKLLLTCASCWAINDSNVWLHTHLATCRTTLHARRASLSMLVGPPTLWYTHAGRHAVWACRDNLKITNRIYFSVVTVLKSLSYVINKKASLSGLYLTLQTHTHTDIYIYIYI
jgi:hypothetical protein